MSKKEKENAISIEDIINDISEKYGFDINLSKQIFGVILTELYSNLLKKDEVNISSINDIFEKIYRNPKIEDIETNVDKEKVYFDGMSENEISFKIGMTFKTKE